MLDKKNLQQKIIEKAWCDENFKKALISNPKKAIKDAFGKDIPDDTAINVFEETEKNLYLIIPQKPDLKHCQTQDGAMW